MTKNVYKLTTLVLLIIVICCEISFYNLREAIKIQDETIAELQSNYQEQLDINKQLSLDNDKLANQVNALINE